MLTTRPRSFAPIVVEDLASYLIGGWDLDRLVNDERAGEHYRFSGRASVVALDATHLHYVESGLLEQGAKQLEVGRSHHYELDHAGHAVVSFTDGSRFFELDLHRGRARLAHVCGADRYLGLVVAEADCWWTRWRVLGPTKRFVSTTRATRLPHGTSPQGRAGTA